MLKLRKRNEQLLLGACRICRRKFFNGRRPQLSLNLDVYTEKPQYPEIKDLSFKAIKKRKEEEWHQQVAKAKTVEEKMIKINMPRYYGYKVVELRDSILPYNCLPVVQHYTRTIFSENTPKAGDNNEANSENMLKKEKEAIVQSLKSDVQAALEYAYDFFRHKYRETQLGPKEHEQKFTQLIVEQINRTLINKLSANHAYLKEVEVDYNPRHEAFWFVGGIDPPKNVVRSKAGNEWQKEMANDPIDRLMQYIGEPYLALRHSDQLPAWATTDETQDFEQLPFYRYDPRTLGYLTSYRHGTNIPGFWPGSRHSFGCISYQSRAQMHLRPTSYGAEDFKETLHAQAIQGSYAWLLAQANNLGFNTFSNLSYPLNTQTIITSGHLWSFYEYQLNTLLVHSHHVHENRKVNYCRGTAELKLYEEFDAAGKCVGLNETVLHHLVDFYTNVPTVQRLPAELTPYLEDPHVHRIADYEKDEKRDFLEGTFKHMASNRPRHLAIPEIYLWEKIYKIDNKLRPMDARRRFFELGINPWKRTMDQRDKVYVPRILRPDVPKYKNRFKETYYP